MSFYDEPQRTLENEVTQLKTERDFYTMELASAQITLGIANALLESLKRGTCWCEVAIGNPMFKQHSLPCREIQRYFDYKDKARQTG